MISQPICTPAMVHGKVADQHKLHLLRMNASITGEPRGTDAAEGGVTRKAASVDQGTAELGVGQKDWLKGTASGLRQAEDEFTVKRWKAGACKLKECKEHQSVLVSQVLTKRLVHRRDGGESKQAEV